MMPPKLGVPPAAPTVNVAPPVPRSMMPLTSGMPPMSGAGQDGGRVARRVIDRDRRAAAQHADGEGIVADGVRVVHARAGRLLLVQINRAGIEDGRTGVVILRGATEGERAAERSGVRA